MNKSKSNNACISGAIYARVSSEQQAKACTINSQVEALLNKAKEDGITIDPVLCFTDNGYSGATLIRPALERLRDQAAAGSFDRLYVYNPFRLARNYAYQVLLIDELQRYGIDVIFLNHKFSDNPEEQLLLQVQGVIAEYERAKIQERSRRGKLHAAHKGVVNVLCNAPYGYRYVSKNNGDGIASYEIILEEAKTVLQVFEWFVLNGHSINEICKLLEEKEILTRIGKLKWDRSVVWGMLKNPAYKGFAAFGKTKCGKMRDRLRRYKGSQEQPRRAYSIYNNPKEEWISIPVPAIVDEKLFEAAQEQLQENRKHNRKRQRGAKHLLQGLLVCKKCGYSYYGKPVSNSAAKGKKRKYVYYRCIGSDAYRFGGERICSNKQIRSVFLEQAVWDDIYTLLSNPNRIEEEYNRRLTIPQKPVSLNSMDKITSRIKDIKRGVSRLIDSYEEGLICKSDFTPRIKRAKKRIDELEKQLSRQQDDEEQIRSLQLVIGRMKDFANKVKEGLDNSDWLARREIIRSIIKKIEIDDNEVSIIYKISPDSIVIDSKTAQKKSLQLCRRGS